MQYRKLGSSPFCVSTVSFGAWQLADSKYWGDFDRSEAEAAVHDAIDAGINLFDTAETYGGGESEVVLGKVLGRRRSDVLIATKVSKSHCSPADLRKSCEASLKRLGSEWIDLYQMHWPSRQTPFDQTAATLEKLRDEGKIRAIGVSNFGAGDLGDWPDAAGLASNQLGYNLVFRAVEFDVVPACQQNDIGILVYMPLMQGLLSGKWTSADQVPTPRRRTRHFNTAHGAARHGGPGCEPLLFDTIGRLGDLAGDLGMTVADLSLASLLAKPAVTSLIVGCRSRDQLRRNLAAANIELDAATRKRIDEITNPLKNELGPNIDMWDVGEAARSR